ncbi:MAG: DsrE family protein [Steroidobacteraceae bacterium]
MIQRAWGACLVLASLALSAAVPAQEAPAEPVRAVYHVFDAGDQPMRALRNLRNHLNADSTATLKLVALGYGLKFLALDAEDDNGNPYEPYVMDLQDDGVTFYACANTLQALGLTGEDLLPGVVVVPSGVAEIARLQTQEGYAYLRP